MRILISGANGFIGSYLAAAAMADGFEVVALSRSGDAACASTRFAWSFGNPLPDAALLGIDSAIHLAHDFEGEEGARRTIESTLAAARQLNGVCRQLFFSSYSAGEHAISLYGRTKFAIERALEEIKDVVIVRPGLVLGDGGLYGRIRKWAQVLPIIPLPDGGHGRIPVISIDKLCQEIFKISTTISPAREVNLFEKELKSLRHLVLEAAQESNRKPWIMPVPSRMLIAALNIAAVLPMRLPITTDNLIGFVANQSARHTSTLDSDIE